MSHIWSALPGQHGPQSLGSYYDVSAGIVAKVASGAVPAARFQHHQPDRFDEGNARVGGNAVQNGVGFGRSILGREYSLQGKYVF